MFKTLNLTVHDDEDEDYDDDDDDDDDDYNSTLNVTGQPDDGDSMIQCKLMNSSGNILLVSNIMILRVFGKQFISHPENMLRKQTPFNLVERE